MTAVVAAVLGVSYAAVPLYKVFCQVCVRHSVVRVILQCVLLTSVYHIVVCHTLMSYFSVSFSSVSVHIPAGATCLGCGPQDRRG